MEVTVLWADVTLAENGTAVIPSRQVVEVTGMRDGVEIYFASPHGRKVSGTIKLDEGACRDLYTAIEGALRVAA